MLALGMQKILLINAAWVLVAGGAFLIGKKQGQGVGSAEGEGGSDRIVRSTARGESGGGGGRFKSGGDEGHQRGARATLSGSAVGMSEEDMVVALEKVLKETDPLKRQKAFAKLLESLTAENAESAAEMLRKAPGGRWSVWQEYSLLMHTWGRLDGQAATEYSNHLEGRAKEWSVRRALAGWATEDPESAKAWVNAVEDKRDWQRYTRGLISGLAQYDVNEATSYVLSIEPEKQDREFMEVIAQHQLSQGIDVAADWAEALPDNQMKGGVMERLADAYANGDAKAAATWAESYVNKDYGVEVVSRVAEEWAESEPAKALEWVTTLEDGEARNEAVKEGLREWARRDMAAAGEFVAALETGDMRDAASLMYAGQVLRENGENAATAMEWVQSISNDHMRQEAVIEVARAWMERDAESAKVWLDGAGLTEEDIQRIHTDEDDASERRRR